MEMADTEARLKIGDVIPGDGRPTPKALAHFLAAPEIEVQELHSLAPWWLAQCRGGSEETAKRSLQREGFEAWYPTYRKCSPTPRKKIASHMRHKKRHHVTVRKLPLYPGYILLRPLDNGVRHYDISRLYELDGCGGLCTWVQVVGDVATPSVADCWRRLRKIEAKYPCPSSRPASVFKAAAALAAVIDGNSVEDRRRNDWVEPVTIPDYRVEGLRLAQESGVNDIYSGVSPHSVMTGIVKDLASAKVMQSRGKILARLDESVGSSLFIDRGDRVLRVITSRAEAKGLRP